MCAEYVTRQLQRGEWLDLASWPRREHFAFFKDYAQPFFSVCTEVDVTGIYQQTRAPGGPSFFVATLYYSARAANETEAFRLRIREGRVWRHAVVHPGSTILRDNHTFAFANFEYLADFEEFHRGARAIIDSLRNDTGALDPAEGRDDLIYYSVLPWIRFTAFTHARRSFAGDSIPRIVFGQHYERAGRRWLPVAVDLHHALADGLDVGRFLERFSALAGDLTAATVGTPRV